MSIAEPALLWLLIGPLVLGGIVLLRHRKRLAQQRKLASPAVWDRLMGGAPATGVARMVLWCLAAVSLVLALARPQWGEIPSEESVRTRDLVLAIDVSDSMLCPDVGPSRLGKAMEIIHRSLPGLEGNRVGAVVFAGEAYALVPLTTDLEAVAAFLAGITPGMVGRPGSNLEAAVAAAVRLLPAEGDGRVIMLFTDGENLQGNVETAAKAVSDAGATVVGVVLGTERGGPIPVVDDSGSVTYKRNREGQPVVTRAEASTLRSMADVVGGEVVVAEQGEAVAYIREAIDDVRTREVETRRAPRRVERFPIFLFLSAAALLASFILSPWRRRAVVAGFFFAVTAGSLPVFAQGQGPPPAVVPPAPAAAGSEATQSTEPGIPPVSWWQRLIPGGSRRLARQAAADWREEDIEGAVEGFAGAAVLSPDDPARIYDLGTALGAAGAAEPALQLLQQAESGGVAEASYNAGTVALTGGQAEPAVQSLRRALMANPEDPDVKRNYELALRLLEQQQEEQQDDQQQEEQQEQDEEQDEEQDNEPQPTPTPEPSGDQAPQPTPTPDPNEGLYSALDRAEADARDAMRTPTPQAATVEKDW